MAGSTGIEPAISSVTGRRDNRFTTSPYCLVAVVITPSNDLNHIKTGVKMQIVAMLYPIVLVQFIVCRSSSVGRAAHS